MIFPRCEWILKEVGVVLSGTAILVVSAIVLVTSVCCLSRRIELVRFVKLLGLCRVKLQLGILGGSYVICLMNFQMNFLTLGPGMGPMLRNSFENSLKKLFSELKQEEKEEEKRISCIYSTPRFYVLFVMAFLKLKCLCFSS